MAASQSYPAPVRNHLLMALPPEVLERMLPDLHPVTLRLRQVLYPADGVIDAVYFPEDSWASLVATLNEGSQVEVGVIGREGILGMALAFGIERSFNEAMMQCAGNALRMGAAAFREAFDEYPELRNLLFRYGEALQAQISQNVACNGWHALEQRLGRWLLMAHDRVDGDDLPLTQDFLAMMLGVHRPSVTVTARILQKAGLISYASGVITVLDRQGLEAASCECYAVVQRQFEKLLGRPVS